MTRSNSMNLQYINEILEGKSNMNLESIANSYFSIKKLDSIHKHEVIVFWI